MITKERIKKAKDYLMKVAGQIEDHIARVRKIAESDFLDKQEGKTVSRRLFEPMARAYGIEGEKSRLSGGELYFPNATFSYDYMPAPLTGRDVPQLKIKVCQGWGAFGIPLICHKDSDRLDAAATREAWEKILELCQKHADERKRAAKKVDKAAQIYNKVEAMVKPFLEEELGGNKVDGIAITTLNAFGGDIYDRLNVFRWHEEKPEVK